MALNPIFENLKGLNIVVGFLILFNLIKVKIGKKGTYILIGAQIGSSILFIVYGIFRLFSSYNGGGGLSMKMT